MGSAATSVAVVLLVREAAVRVGPASSLRAVLPSNRQAAWLAGLLAIGYAVLGFGMRRESLPTVLGGQLTVWVMYAIVVGLLWLAHRQARRLPFALADPYDPPTRASLVTLAIAFTVAALVGSQIGAIAPWFGVAVLIVGTLTGAVWFGGVVVRTLARPGT